MKCWSQLLEKVRSRYHICKRNRKPQEIPPNVQYVFFPQMLGHASSAELRTAKFSKSNWKFSNLLNAIFRKRHTEIIRRQPVKIIDEKQAALRLKRQQMADFYAIRNLSNCVFPEIPEKNDEVKFQRTRKGITAGTVGSTAVSSMRGKKSKNIIDGGLMVLEEDCQDFDASSDEMDDLSPVCNL